MKQIIGLVEEEEEEEEEEKKRSKRMRVFLKWEETYDVDKSVFTPTDLEEMNNRERVMTERSDRSYYRCNIWGAK